MYKEQRGESSRSPNLNNLGVIALANNETMKNSQVVKLNSLFEKMVSNSANALEERELNYLYQEYINDGRDSIAKSRMNRRQNKVAVA